MRCAGLKCVAHAYISGWTRVRWTDGWCNLRNTFHRDIDARKWWQMLHEGISRRRDAGQKSGLIPGDAIRRLRREAAYSRGGFIARVIADDWQKRGISRDYGHRRKRKKKEQKYEAITPGELRYYWKLLTQWKWAIGVAGGPRGSLLLLFSTLRVACHPPRPFLPLSGDPLSTDKHASTLNFGTLLPSKMKSRNACNCRGIIADRRQTWRTRSSDDDEISISNCSPSAYCRDVFGNTT